MVLEGPPDLPRREEVRVRRRRRRYRTRREEGREGRVKTGILQSRQSTRGRSSGIAYYEFELLILEGILNRCASS